MIKPVIIASLPALIVYTAHAYGWSITTINVISGVIALTLGMGLTVAGAMANDSGKGGGFIYSFQFLSITYPLVFIAGLIGSIAVSYSDYEDRDAISTLLASMSLFWLELIALLFLAGIVMERAERSRGERRREREIANQKKPYLVHLPHAGTRIPDEFRDDYYLSEDELKNNVEQYADLHTDVLYAPLIERFGAVKSDYSRLFFDSERFFDDDSEKLSKSGLGWFYERAILSDEPLRHSNNKQVIAGYYHRHHDELNRQTREKLEQYGRCTIIDCHSFSNERYWFHDPEMALPDICIGYDEEHVDRELVELLKETFDGYTLAINSPYSGSLVPSEFYNKDKRVKSVMIEINKRLYLDENNQLGNDYERLHLLLEMVMSHLVFESNRP